VTVSQILPLVIPLIVIQLILDAICLADLLRDDRRVRGGNKGLWAVAILFLQYVGPIAYLVVGRIDE
jgi:Phospholipase_D-nuclease N-terminal